MRILPVIQHLIDNVALLSGRVEQAKSMTSLPDNEIKNSIPVAFVYSSVDTSPGMYVIDPSQQEVTVEFTVILASKQIDIKAGIEHMEDLRDQVKAALIGWKIDANHRGITFQSGALLDISPRTVWWADTFSVKTII